MLGLDNAGMNNNANNGNNARELRMREIDRMTRKRIGSNLYM